MNRFWLAIGLIGQATFASRFLVQWLASEKARKSVVPVPFWLLSIVGALLLLSYAIHIGDPVFTIGQSAGLFIYARNMVLIRREVKAGSNGA